MFFMAQCGCSILHSSSITSNLLRLLHTVARTFTYVGRRSDLIKLLIDRCHSFGTPVSSVQLVITRSRSHWFCPVPVSYLTSRHHHQIQPLHKTFLIPFRMQTLLFHSVLGRMKFPTVCTEILLVTRFSAAWASSWLPRMLPIYP